MKAGLVGSSYQQASLPFDAQRSVNLYPVLDQAGKDIASMYGTGGLGLQGTIGTGPGRGGFLAANGRAFVVSGSSLWETQNDGTGVIRGALDQSQGIVTIEENGFQLAICDGVSLYIFTYATNDYQKVVTPNLPSAASVCFIDGYFVVNRVNSGIFQICALYNGLVWNALDFATAESSPDNLLRVLNVVGQLWLQGAITSEIWSNTGAAAFPFSKIAGAKMETGTGAAYSAIALDNSVLWVGQDKQSFGIIYRAQGFTPQRISTDAIELRIRLAPNPSTLRSFAREEGGHIIYVLTGGGMETTLNYDLATQEWFETAYLNSEGNYELHLGITGFFAFGKTLVLDKNNGNIYEMSQKYYDDNGDPIARDRIFTHLIDENKRFKYKNLTVGFEVGVGTQTGQGFDPQALLSLSRDGGKNFYVSILKPLGQAGKFLTRVIWDRLGQARQLTFRLRITDPIPVHITGSWFNT